jgi:hypothetical protein
MSSVGAAFGFDEEQLAAVTTAETHNTQVAAHSRHCFPVSMVNTFLRNLSRRPERAESAKPGGMSGNAPVAAVSARHWRRVVLLSRTAGTGLWCG